MYKSYTDLLSRPGGSLPVILKAVGEFWKIFRIKINWIPSIIFL